MKLIKELEDVDRLAIPAFAYCITLVSTLEMDAIYQMQFYYMYVCSIITSLAAIDD